VCIIGNKPIDDCVDFVKERFFRLYGTKIANTTIIQAALEQYVKNLKEGDELL